MAKLKKIPSYRPLVEDRFAQHQRQMLYMLAAIESSRGELSRLREDLRRVKTESHNDPLTSILNHRGLENEWSRFAAAYKREYYKSVVIVYIDLNGFKLFNDYLGHHIGDGLLTGFAKQLQETIRPTDIVARVGGDEFVLVLPGSNAGGATALMDRILALSGELYMDRPECVKVARARGADRVLDFSWGMTETLHPNDLPELEHLLKAAESKVEKFNSRRSLFAEQC